LERQQSLPQLKGTHDTTVSMSTKILGLFPLFPFSFRIVAAIVFVALAFALYTPEPSADTAILSALPCIFPAVVLLLLVSGGNLWLLLDELSRPAECRANQGGSVVPLSYRSLTLLTNTDRCNLSTK